MPLTKKGKTILTAMRDQYGDRAEEVFYRSINAGKIKGAEKTPPKKGK
jgi:hypothetical protein